MEETTQYIVTSGRVVVLRDGEPLEVKPGEKVQLTSREAEKFARLISAAPAAPPVVESASMRVSIPEGAEESMAPVEEAPSWGRSRHSSRRSRHVDTPDAVDEETTPVDETATDEPEL